MAVAEYHLPSIFKCEPLERKNEKAFSAVCFVRVLRAHFRSNRPSWARWSAQALRPALPAFLNRNHQSGDSPRLSSWVRFSLEPHCSYGPFCGFTAAWRIQPWLAYR